MNEWKMPRGYTDEEGLLEANRCLSCRHPSCETGCPTSMRIRDFIKCIKENHLDEAYEIIHECSSLPSICSIVCPHERQCEGHCILNHKNKPIHCGALERYVVERVSKPFQVDKQRKNHVAIVGAGPAGISCAMEIAKRGVSVTIYEALDYFGGVMSMGIPNYRLDFQKVKEIEFQIEELGIQVIYHSFLKEQDILNLKDQYDAVFIGIGLPEVKKLGIPGEFLPEVYDALHYLKQVNETIKYGKESMPQLNGTVVVVGAGNVAMDAARCAIRSGANVIVAYRRSRLEAPATKEEIAAAEADGVQFEFLNSPVEVIGDQHVKGLKVEQMVLGDADSSGRRKPVGTGKFKVIPCNYVISAIGQNPSDIYNVQRLKTDHLYLDCDNFKTNVEGIYAGGDIVLGAKTVVEAMVCGRKAANLIMQRLDNDLKA